MGAFFTESALLTEWAKVKLHSLGYFMELGWASSTRYVTLHAYETVESPTAFLPFGINADTTQAC